MSFLDILILGYSLFIVIGAFCVVSVNNPIYAVVLLILTMLNAASLLLCFGMEYLAFILIIIYVGAISVLFLFVVMMIDINYKKNKGNGFLYGFCGFLLFILIMVFVIKCKYLFFVSVQNFFNWIEVWNGIDLTEISAIGFLVLRPYYLIMAGLLLLLAMLSAISLTMIHSIFVKRQSSYLQLKRDAVVGIYKFL